MQTEQLELLKTVMGGVISEMAADFKLNQKEWLNLNEAAEYIGVAPNTLKKLRVQGLPICEIDGTSVKRVSRTAIDQFMNNFSN